METLDVPGARRLALARAGLLKPEWSGFPVSAGRGERRARAAAHAVIGRFGYLQLDTVSVAGARSHAIVLLSRLPGFAPELGESLLQPGEPLFEYWGHEASWLPLDLYPVFAFRRKRFRKHPWWGDILVEHRDLARELLRRVRNDGPLRSTDLEGTDHGPWWGHRPAKKVAVALWSSGELAVRERRNFQRAYDLAERVIPEALRRERVGEKAALRTLVLKALDGHGWAETGAIVQTFRLMRHRAGVERALAEMATAGEVVPCALNDAGRRVKGWIRPGDLELAGRLRPVRPRRDRGVLLSPFDPVLWDRKRVQRLFGFEQMLEIFKPAAKRTYGYYCLPVLAGERLVARVDLKAERDAGWLRVLSCRYESGAGARPAADAEAVRTAVARYAGALGLEVREG